MAICLPGMASRVKRALTSEIRPAPLVTTTKLMITEDGENHYADHVVTADHHLTESLDDLFPPHAGLPDRSKAQPG